MLSRFAACFVSLGLLVSVADARGFAQPPVAQAERRVPPGYQQLPDKAKVRSVLEARRANNLASFRAYRKAGVYPHNTVRVGPLNVWKDADGHLCAAATMIFKDGKTALVEDTAKTNNQIRLQNVTEGALLDWIMTSGFTIEEIDMIQAPMVMPSEPIEPEPRDYLAEDAKLKAGYAKTDAYLVKHAKASLDRAVERLMRSPDLARKMLAGEA